MRIFAIIAMAAMLSGFTPLADQVQYGGWPAWDRRRNPEYERFPRNPFPPPRRNYGPADSPCIRFGDCRGSRERNLNDPRPYPMPGYPPRYEDD